MAARLADTPGISLCVIEAAGRDRFLFFFFFQAEDDIRDLIVTGVQTCALPILDFVHAAIVTQGQLTGGFPYVLMRAHEIAVVTHAERRLLDDALHTALIRRGLAPSISQKQQGKAWTNSPKQRFG